MRILITGVNGFAGGHLTEALLAQGSEDLYGLSRRGAWPEEWRDLEGLVTLDRCDLCDLPALEARVRDIQPERIFHLAGYANVGNSFQEVEAAWAGNLTTTRNLYEAVARWGGRPRILFVGSGLIYGEPGSANQACHEESPLQPSSPYAASKAAADLASYQYTRFPGLDIVRVRPFNHIGPRQSLHYAVSHFAEQIAAIEHSRHPPWIETGNLSPERDLTDVRDMASAYLLLMEKGRTGEVYNAASGQAHSMQSVLDQLLALTQIRVEIRQQANLMRAAENFALLGDAGKLRRETGWAPRYSLEQTLADTLNYCRSKG